MEHRAIVRVLFVFFGDDRSTLALVIHLDGIVHG